MSKWKLVLNLKKVNVPNLALVSFYTKHVEIVANVLNLLLYSMNVSFEFCFRMLLWIKCVKHE